MCEVRLPSSNPYFYLGFTGRGQVSIASQHVFDMCNEGCPHAGDSGEISYLVVHGPLQRVRSALYSSTVHEDLISMPA